MKNVLVRNAIQYISKNPWAQRASVVLIVLLVGYALVQPQLNQRLGWNLPGIPGIEQKADIADAGQRTGSDEEDLERPTAESPIASSGADNSRDSRNETAATHNASQTAVKASSKAAASTTATLGKLTEIRRNVFESTAGLLYVPGSQEGHRKKHVLKHAKDIPDRQGSHGVFDGGEDKVFVVLDEAYEQVKKRSSQVRTKREGSRDVHEVDMKRRIGYVGGSTGRRQGKPAANHVRMVLEGSKVITAFPFRK